jgi:hypothetical protein
LMTFLTRWWKFQNLILTLTLTLTWRNILELSLESIISGATWSKCANAGTRNGFRKGFSFSEKAFPWNLNWLSIGDFHSHEIPNPCLCHSSESHFIWNSTQIERMNTRFPVRLDFCSNQSLNFTL